MFLLIPLLLFGGFILSVHNKALADSWDTFAITILQPNAGPFSDIIHYLPTLLRVPLAWWNAWIGISNVLKRAIVETFQSCTITRWGDIATAIGEFALSIVQGLGNWILSRFADELDVATMIQKLGAVFATFLEPLNCMCSMLGGLWDIIITVLNTPALSQWIHHLVNFVISIV